MRISKITCVALVVPFVFAGMLACGGGGGSSDASDAAENLIVVKFALVDQVGNPTGARGATNAYRNNRIHFTFSEDVLGSSVDDRTIQIGIPSGTNLFLTAQGRFTTDGNEVLFDPTVTATGAPNPFGLEADSDYTVIVKGLPEPKTIRSIADDQVMEEFRTTFKTTDKYLPDLDQPRAKLVMPPGLSSNDLAVLLQMTPAERVADNEASRQLDGNGDPIPDTGRWEQMWVSSKADVDVTFSEAMNPATFDSVISFRVVNLDRNSREVFGIFIYSDDATEVKFRPTFGFGRGPYLIQVTMSVDLTDLAENPIGNPQQWIFLTEYDPTAVNEGLFEEYFDDNVNEDTAFSPPGAEGIAAWNPQTDPGKLVSTFGTNSTTVPTPLSALNSGNCIPLGSGGSWGDYFCQLWYSSSVMGNAGTISGWKYFLYTGSAGQTPTLVGITIQIGNSKTQACPFGANNQRASHFAGTPVTCVSNTDLTVPSVAAGTPIAFPKFTKSFGYDGSSSVVVDLQKKNGTGTNTYWSIFSNSNGARAYGNPSSKTTITGITFNYLYQCVFDFRTEASMAQSLWFTSESNDPTYLESIVAPTEQPPGTETVVEYQGTHDDGTGLPDTTTQSQWVTDVEDLAGFQLLRFRVRFTANLSTGIGPKLEEIVIPYIFF